MDTCEKHTLAIVATTLILGYACEEISKKKTRRKRKCWVKPWLAIRKNQGAYENLVTELSLAEREEYHRFMRMDHETFHVSKLIYRISSNERPGR